jgi:protein-L-isoaspartate(D-aspartate) O-methyltransferase
MNSSGENNTFSILRQRMVESQLRARGIGDERVLAAMLRVPRHEFAPERYRDQAYDDHPLPIGEGQTISQPYIVARMLESLTLSPVDKVLEIGTGSGYLTALLAELAAEVFSVERHAILADAARNLLTVMGYNNVTVIVGDGTSALRRRHCFGCGSRGSRRAARTIGRGWAIDYSYRNHGFTAAAINSHGERRTANFVA